MLYKLCMLPIRNQSWLYNFWLGVISPMSPPLRLLVGLSWFPKSANICIISFYCFFAFLLFIGKVEQILWYIYLWWHKSRQHLLASAAYFLGCQNFRFSIIYEWKCIGVGMNYVSNKFKRKIRYNSWQNRFDIWLSQRISLILTDCFLKGAES